MQSFHFTYANFRYLVFQIDGQYYLLDRRPNHLIGYLFMPLNWFFYQRIYPITNEDYHKIKQKNDRLKHLVLPSTLGAGLSVFVGNWLRIHHVSKYFETDFSLKLNIILALMGIFLSFILAGWFYRSRKRSITSLTYINVEHPLYYKLVPSKISWKMIITYIAYLILIVGTAILSLVGFIYLGNLVFLLTATLLVFLHLIAVNLAYSTDSDHFYRVVDIRQKRDNHWSDYSKTI